MENNKLNTLDKSSKWLQENKIIAIFIAIFVPLFILLLICGIAFISGMAVGYYGPPD